MCQTRPFFNSFSLQGEKGIIAGTFRMDTRFETLLIWFSCDCVYSVWQWLVKSDKNYWLVGSWDTFRNFGFTSFLSWRCFLTVVIIAELSWIYKIRDSRLESKRKKLKSFMYCDNDGFSASDVHWKLGNLRLHMSFWFRKYQLELTIFGRTRLVSPFASFESLLSFVYSESSYFPALWNIRLVYHCTMMRLFCCLSICGMCPRGFHLHPTWIRSTFCEREHFNRYWTYDTVLILGVKKESFEKVEDWKCSCSFITEWSSLTWFYFGRRFNPKFSSFREVKYAWIYLFEMAYPNFRPTSTYNRMISTRPGSGYRAREIAEQIERREADDRRLSYWKDVAQSFNKNALIASQYENLGSERSFSSSMSKVAKKCEQETHQEFLERTREKLKRLFEQESEALKVWTNLANYFSVFKEKVKSAKIAVANVYENKSWKYMFCV